MKAFSLSTPPPLPLRPLFAAYRLGGLLHAAWRSRHTRPHPGGTILSLGSLSFGGVGKTPLAANLALDLYARGHRVALISRPYGAAAPTREVIRVSPDTSPERAGDEALVLCHLAPDIPVFCAQDRYQAFLEARKAGADTLVLDDGLLDRTLPRDLDLLILHPLHPRASLRSSPRLLRMPHRILALGQTPTWWPGQVDGRFNFLPLAFRTHLGTPAAPPERVFAFCGLADPHRFHSDVTRIAPTGGVRFFPDHHAYRSSDITLLCREALASGAQALVTSLKDMVKIARLPLEAQPLPFLWLANRIQSDFSWKELIADDAGR